MSLWTNEDVLKLIKLFQAKPILWDPKHSQHKVKKKIRDAWMSISQDMGISVFDLKRKRDSLMASYRNIVKKQKDALTGSNEVDFNYRPVWMFYDVMNSFLGDLYNTASLPYSQNTQENHAQYDDEITHQDTSSTHNTLPGKRSYDDSYLPEKRSRMPYQLLVKRPLNQGNIENDECEIYGKLFVSKLKKFPENERQDIMLAIDSFIVGHSKSMRNRAQNQRSTPSTNVSASSSAFHRLQTSSKLIISTPEVCHPTESVCVIQVPKLEKEGHVFADNISDPLNTSQEGEEFSDSDDD